MKLTKFNKITARTYKNFVWPSDLQEFSDYNLIYGWNGSGKTTLSDILRMIEKRQPVGEEGISDFSFTYDGRNITNATIATEQSPPSIRVFNRAFIEKNVFDKDGAAPIFFIGEENIEKQKDLVQEKAALTLVQASADSKAVEKQKKENELSDFCQAKASEIRAHLNITSQNSYHKGAFASDCDAIEGKQTVTTYIKTDEELSALKKTINSPDQAKIGSIPNDFPGLKTVRSDVEGLLKKTVVSQTIEALTKDQKISDWVKEGVEIHQAGKFENCQFCLQKIPANRLKELEGHFNDEYNALDASLKSKATDIAKIITTLNSVVKPDSAKLYADLVIKYDIVCQTIDGQIKDWIAFLSSLLDAIEDKKKKPFIVVAFDEAAPLSDTISVDAINSIITEHNTRADNFTQSINDARQAIKMAIAASNLQQYKTLKAGCRDVEQECKNLASEIDTSKQAISLLEQDIIDNKKPAEDINKDLQNYLRHGELKFTTGDKDIGYTIMRGNEVAHALSEGEKTAIALLHFLKSLEDRNFDLKTGIVVIDDPVCSLDDTALFYAFSFIKDRARNAKQLFILTHNFSFFRQVKNWLTHLKKKEGRRASFYQTVCAIEGSVRISRLKELDSLLLDYESEYQYLFDLIYQASTNTGAASLDQYYHIPNVARRLLESFLAFRMPGTHDGLESKLEKLNFDVAKRTRILRFLHTYSHEDHVGQSEHDSSILSETPQVLGDLIALIKSEDERHYNAMIELVENAENEVAVAS